MPPTTRSSGSHVDVRDGVTPSATAPIRWGGPVGWMTVAKSTAAQAKRNATTLSAAGVAFYALLAIVPAMVAMVSIYGLVADPADIQRQVDDSLASAPAEVRDFVSQQLSSVTENASSAGWALLFGLLIAVWSAASGMSHLLVAVNRSYDQEETRGFQLRLLALAFTAGAVAFVLVAVGAISILPNLVEDWGSAGRLLVLGVRWPLLVGGFIGGAGMVYRFGPVDPPTNWRFISPGAVFAAVIWLLGSVAFSVYTSTLGSYQETYGSLGTVVIVMLWLLVCSLAVLLGAEVNAEIERSRVPPDEREGASGAAQAHASEVGSSSSGGADAPVGGGLASSDRSR